MDKVTIVIPSRNEEKYIGRCLDSIIAQNFPKSQLEALVCDGRSTDRTPEIVRKYSKGHRFIHLLINEQQTAPHAFNLGIEKAAGEVIIILGAHAELHPDYVKESLAAFRHDETIGCVGGIIENIYENITSRAIGYAMSQPFGVGNAFFRTGQGEGFVDTVAFGAYKKAVFQKAGLFDTSLTRNQDDELNFRLTKAGYKIWLSKKIRSRYYVRASFRKLFRQYFQYGYWKVYVNRKHRTVTTARQLAPMLLVAFLVVGLCTVFSKGLLLLYLSIVGLYLLLALWFAVKARQGLKQTVRIVYTFFILHLSYGLGYWEGILQFLIFNKKPAGSRMTLSR